MDEKTGRAALVLTGGGARAAYQVGVLQAIRHIRGPRPGNPFPILCGTSAGGINATALAVYSADFNAAVRKLSWIWRNFCASQVYRTDAAALLGSGLRWGSALFAGWAVRQTPRSLLDNSPLRALLERTLDFNAIDQSIDAGHLHAVSVTVSGYTSGESLAFFSGHPSIQPWRRAQRIGTRARLGVDHLLASSAIPFVFPAARINREYFGDGSMRQLAPVSPAIHLGADRILVIGSGRLAEEGRQRTDSYPSPAQIAGHTLSSIFLDGLAVDLERMERINETLGCLSEAQRAAAGIRLRPIETLVISPSQRLDAIAGHHRESLPPLLRAVLRGVGAMRREGSTLLSYLLFEQSFTRALMDLGYQDTLARRDEVAAFLRLDASV
ncbi:Patatin [Parazoarcus communis]|uniref:Patatin n=1 Tax=Parazoarcus communis TaxID=41977 RepID=A0A2U8GTQ3_9RHOO|nr:patatin-like phospholipase family protein [Parazoarcus communis]AWI77052.1 Patatin [Parazoarcus communis]|tara:strand:+ start:38257 stop:39405 length:1149 start_codon:yes stop_codon:yes gene_type:complete